VKAVKNKSMLLNNLGELDGVISKTIDIFENKLSNLNKRRIKNSNF
jgi:hypothetical protein